MEQELNETDSFYKLKYYEMIRNIKENYSKLVEDEKLQSDTKSVEYTLPDNNVIEIDNQIRLQLFEPMLSPIRQSPLKIECSPELE